MSAPLVPSVYYWLARLMKMSVVSHMSFGLAKTYDAVLGEYVRSETMFGSSVSFNSSWMPAPRRVSAKPWGVLADPRSVSRTHSLSPDTPTNQPFGSGNGGGEGGGVGAGGGAGVP